MSMKKVLLLFFAILSVSIAASAKQQTTVFETEDFENFPSTNPASGSYFDADLTHWFSFIKDNPTYENAVLNGNTDAYHGEKSVRINNSTFNSIPVLLIRPAKKGIVQYYVKMALNGTTITKASESQGIYKINYDSSTSTYTVGTQLCQFPQSLKDGSTEWTLVQAELDEDSYIAITCGGSYIDYYQNIQITLLPNTVSGTIKNTNNETISGATVELLKDGKVAYTTTSGENGKYTFGEPVPNGTYTLRVTAAGYKVYTAESATDISDDTYNLDAEIVPLPTWSFGGQVTGDNGSAIGDLSVTLVDCKNNTFNAITGNDGKFVFSDVTEGKVTLTINSESLGYKPFEKEYTVEQDRTDYTFELENYTLSGSVIDEANAPIPDATVVLKQGDTQVSSVTTDTNGTFSFGGLKEGDYTLTASADGYVTDSDAIDLNGGADVDKQFVLEMSVSTITGTVTRSDTGDALGSVEVKLLSGDAQVATATSAADNGRYTFTITGKFAEAGYTLQVAASEYYEEYLSEEAVTPTYGGSITQDIAISPVLQKYIVVIENENHEALLDSKVTIVKKVTKTIDSFEYLGDNSDVVKALKENGWLAVTAPNLTLARSSAYRYEGIWSIKVPNETMGYTATFVRAAKAGSVSLKAAKESSTGTIYVYKMTDNGNGTYSKSGDPIASNTNINSSTDWSEVSFTLTEDCIIGFVVKRAYIDYYVNDFGPEAQATTAPAYAAPALAAAADETPETIKIDKNLIDLKTITVTIPKVDNPGGEYTATATAPGATLKVNGAAADVWDFTFGVDETHTSVFTGGTVTGVSDVSVDSSEAAEAEYYTLQGVRVTNPQSGIYICRRGSATSKVLIR